MLNVIYTRMTLSSQEKHYFRNENSFVTPYFTLFLLSHASDNTTSQNIGGSDAWAVPPTSNFSGTVSPVPPRSPPLLSNDRSRGMSPGAAIARF